MADNSLFQALGGSQPQAPAAPGSPGVAAAPQQPIQSSMPSLHDMLMQHAQEQAQNAASQQLDLGPMVAKGSPAPISPGPQAAINGMNRAFGNKSTPVKK